jgi:signal transduction histidine kinase
MTLHFNAMSAALERQHHARLNHLAGLAHDLKNPLAALQMSSALVDPARPLPPESSIRGALALVRGQVGRLNRMVDDLLDAARIDAGHLHLRWRATDLRHLVDDVAVLFKDVSELHTIEVDVCDDPLTVRCDPLRIEQTLSNLVSNTIKYSPRGSRVAIRVFQDGQGVCHRRRNRDPGGRPRNHLGALSAEGSLEGSGPRRGLGAEGPRAPRRSSSRAGGDGLRSTGRMSASR